tara:strand:- start:624 stop:830 length:207 start_codon:yes stop_codon:yes gene_type:complete
MPEEDAYLTRCVVDTTSRSYHLYSSDGSEKIIECDTPEEFMNVLKLCREVLDDIDEGLLVYTEPAVKS